MNVSPFSTNGALVLANAPETMDRDVVYGQILRYSILVTLAGPLVAWATMVVVPDLI